METVCGKNEMKRKVFATKCGVFFLPPGESVGIRVYKLQALNYIEVHGRKVRWAYWENSGYLVFRQAE